MKLIAITIALTSLVAQEPASLAIRNLRYDAKKATVEFDVASVSAKPIHSWLITVLLGDGTSILTPRNCSAAGHCQASVDFGEDAAANVKPEVRISAVLFEDGTAEGDLRLLQSEIDEAQLRLRALEAWTQNFNTTPPGIAYTSAVMNEREIVELLAAKLTPAQRASMLAQRVRAAQEQARLFPASGERFAPEEAESSLVAIANRTSRFTIVHQEEHEGKLRLVLRNDYEKDIVAFAFIEQQADGRLMRSSNGHAIASGRLEEFNYGPAANPLELACVIFRDGTADGDPAVVQKMRDGWAGRKAEKERILPMVSAAANLPVSERSAAVRKLVDDLQAHPQERPDPDHSIDFVMGEQAERKTVLLDLRNFSLEQTLRDLRE